jgi:hypothetical protein
MEQHTKHGRFRVRSPQWYCSMGVYGCVAHVCALSRKTVVSVPNGMGVPNSDSKYRCAAPTTAESQPTQHILASANAFAVRCR